jgi:TonB-linked SusC/RagA family outer membrane protein
MNIGTLTRPDGTYVLIIPAGRFQAGQTVQLRGQQVGYRAVTQEVTLQEGTVTQNFMLALDPLRLQEVVVTGAGLVARAERLGTARATVDSAMLQRSAEPNVITALANKAPNLVTTQAGGEPGASTAIRIRGTSTLAGTGQPTIIVDGMPINNVTRTGGLLGVGGSTLQGPAYPNRAFDLNPDDIESIEILKGPAAMSLLGASAGAGGAILITTKRGRPGITRYSLRSELQFDRPIRNLPVQQRFTSGVDGAPTPCYRDRTPGCTHNNPNWGPRIAEGTPVYNHARDLFETGTMWDNTLTMSGGTEATTFYMSLSSLNHNGFIAGDADQYHRRTVRLNAGHGLRQNLRVNGNVAYTETDGRFVQRGNAINGLLLGALRAPPDWNHQEYLDPETGFHRTYRFPQPRAQDFVNGDRGFDNPFFVINAHENTNQVGRVYGNVNAAWQPLDWLSVNYTLGADYANDDRTEALHPSASGLQAGGNVVRWQFYDRIVDHTLTATASWQLNPQWSGTFSLGQNLNQQQTRQIWVQGNRLIAPFPFKLENTIERLVPVDQEFTRRLAGHFAQAEVDFAEQVFLTGRVRVDGSSAFGLDNQFATYPGGQAAWVFTRTFNIPENILQHGRLRVAYGESGQEPALYQLQDTFEGTEIIDFNPGSTLVPTLAGWGGLYSRFLLGNPEIRPERVREVDAGFDVSVLGGRADFALTYYASNADDVVFAVQQPPSTGWTQQSANTASIRNRGWEVVLNTRPISTPEFGATLGVNWAQNRNEVTDLGEIAPGIPRELTGFAVSFTGLGQTFAEVGQPVGIYRGTSFARCGISPGDLMIGGTALSELCAGQPHGAVYLGANGFPVNDPNQRVLGSPHHDWTAGINAEVAFRGVRLSAFIDHRQGGEVLNMTRGSMEQFGTHANTDVRDHEGRPWNQWLDYDRFQVFGPGTTAAEGGGPVPVTLGRTWFAGWTARQDLFIEDATHTRLRELSLAYTFTQPFVTRTLGLAGIDARISGRNLALWTDYSGHDPDVHVGGAALGNRGIDWWVNPTARSWVLSFGINR